MNASTTTDRTFEVGPQAVLSLTALTARVTTNPGPAGRITVTIEGSRRYLDSVTITQDGDTVSLVESGDGRVGDVTVISTGHGRRSVTVTSGDVVIAGSRIVVGGVDVSGRAGHTGGVVEPEPVITITVPDGTNTHAERCRRVDLRHGGGRLIATVAGQGLLVAPHLLGARLTVRGQSTVGIGLAGGTLTGTVSGQSTLTLSGHATSVHLTVSGQSTVTGNGTFEDVTGTVSGQSTTNVSGQIGADSLASSGQSTALVNGRPSGSRPTPPRRGGWDF